MTDDAERSQEPNWLRKKSMATWPPGRQARRCCQATPRHQGGAANGHAEASRFPELRILAFIVVIGLCARAPSLAAADQLVGTWRLQGQEINGQKGDHEPLALRVSEAGDKLTFAFSVPINEIYFVTLSYTLRLNGSDADIKDANGQTVGTIQMTRGVAGQYKLVMKGPNRPDSQGTLTVSADGKALISESDAQQSGRLVHSKQTFARDR